MDSGRRNETQWPNTLLTYTLAAGGQGEGEREHSMNARALICDEKQTFSIDNFAVGDKVYFRGNDTMALADGTSVTCDSGAHSSHIVTRPNTTHGVDHMIPGAAMDVACMFVMPAVGLYGVVRRL